MLRLLFWTAWILLAATTVGHAAPLVAAVAAIASAIGSLGVIGQIILGVALNVGVSLLNKALQKDEEAGAAALAGVKGQLQVGGDLPMSFIVGTYATAGSLEYVNTWGEVDKTPNAYLTLVISLSDLPVSGLSSTVWVNGQKCTIDAGTPHAYLGNPVVEFQQEGQDHLWVSFYDGTQGVADEFLLSVFGSDPERPWQADMIGRGVAYVVATARINPELFTGVPQLIFVVDGIKLYDVRKDSTAGGSGPHRWDAPATWEFSRNPKVIQYNVIRGISRQGEWVYGGQNMFAARLPASSWMAAMNECDVQIALVGGGTENQFIAGAQIDVDREPLAIVEELDKACNGRTAEIGGFYKTHVGAPPLPVYAFGDEDIVVTKGQSFEPFPGLENTYNGIHATYPEPEEAWADKDAPPRYNATYEASDDNRRLIAATTFPMVPNGRQVQQLMKSMIEAERRFRRHDFFLPPEAWLLEPVVDSVSWTSSRNGYSSKTFLIASMLDHPNCLQEVALQEVDPSDYNWSPSDQIPSSVGFLGPIRPPVQLLSGWQVQPATIFDEQGNPRRPSIEVFFDGDLDDVRAVRVQVRLAATGAGIFDGELPYGPPTPAQPVRSVVLNGTFLPLTVYEVRGIFTPYSRRPMGWSFWLPVTTPDVRLGTDDFYPIDIDALAEDLKGYYEWLGDSIRATREELERLNALASDQSSLAFLDRQEIRVELSSTTENVRAEYTSLITIATSEIAAIAQRVDTLAVSIDDIEEDVDAQASIISQQTALITNIEGVLTVQASDITILESALNGYLGSNAVATAVSSLNTQIIAANGQISINASAILAVSAELDDFSGDATFRIETGYTPSAGWLSRIGMQARVNSAGTFHAAGLFLESTASASRIVLDADQVVVTSGANVAAVFQSGTSYFNNALINNLTSNNILAGSINATSITAGTIDSPSLAFNAVTDFNSAYVPLSSQVESAGAVLSGSTLVVTNVGANMVLLQASCSIQFNKGAGGGSASATVYVYRSDGPLMGSKTVNAPNDSGGTFVANLEIPIAFDISAPSGTYNYYTYYSISGGMTALQASSYLVALWWKR